MDQTLEYASPTHQLTKLRRARNVFGKFIALGGWLFMAWILLSGAGVLAFGFGGPVATYFGLLLGLLVLVTWGVWRRIARVRRANLVLSHLRVGVALNLPLPMVLGSAASGESGRTRRQLLQLREAMIAGSPIGVSLAIATPELPPRTLDILIAAERNGTLGVALNRVADHTHGSSATARVRSTMQGTYALLAMISGLFVMSIVMIFVVPKFEQIFKDFKVQLPWEMKLVLSIARHWQVPIALFGLTLPLFVLWITGSAARSIFVAAVPTPLMRGWRDRIRWFLPITRQLDRDRGLADVCEVFADGIAAGRPAGNALDVAILPSINQQLAEKLAGWSQLLHMGRPLHESAIAVGLPQMFGVLLAPGFAADGSGEALRFLSRYYRDRHERLLAVLRAAIGPMTTLLLGSVVLLLTLGLFRSIDTLIQAVAPMKAVMP